MSKPPPASDTPTLKNEADKYVYGLNPALKLKPWRQGGHKGTITEMNHREMVIGTYEFDDNDEIVPLMEGRRVMLPPGYPLLKERLEAHGAIVRVYHKRVPSHELAQGFFDDVIWI